MAQAANNVAIQSAAASGGVIGKTASHLSLWTASTGGSLLRSAAIGGTPPGALTSGQRLQIASGDLVITYNTATGETEASARRAAAGAVAGGVWVQWHEGAPGSNGTDNVIALDRVQVTQAQFTVT